MECNGISKLIKIKDFWVMKANKKGEYPSYSPFF